MFDCFEIENVFFFFFLETENSEESEDYSIEEMKMMHDYDDEEGLGGEEDEHEMSVVDDHGNSNKTSIYHINLFGDIVLNAPETESVTAPKNASTTAAAKEVTELLFHPANFKKDDTEEDNDQDDHSIMKSEHFNDMMFSIQDVYKRIGNVQCFFVH